MNIIAELLVVLVLLLCNGVLAMSEIAIVSARKARLHRLAAEGDRGAQVALDLAGQPNKFFSTIQIGITLVGVTAGAFGGATIADELTAFFLTIPKTAPYAETLSVSIVVACITYVTLILGELVPKRIASVAPEKIACIIAPPMATLAYVARPLVSVLSASTELITRLFGIKETEEAQVTEAEIQVLIDQATQAGIFEASEKDIIASVLRLGDRRVDEVMTPHHEICWINVNDSIEKIVEKVSEHPHSRFPVSEESLDVVLGVVDARRLFRKFLTGETVDLRAELKQPLYVPENTTALKVLEKFSETAEDMALVLDEYGGLLGLVTTDDVFASIIGTLPSKAMDEKWEVQRAEDGTLVIDAQMHIEYFKDLVQLDELPDEDEYNTVAGFLLHLFRRLPETGEAIDHQELRFEVVKLDRHRIETVRIKKL